ncbi:MAG: hypothetical protein JNL39_08210 [Opitutaceae bacterium]|nr:hypothetical protein [Opitutaceae bacterium]
MKWLTAIAALILAGGLRAEPEAILALIRGQPISFSPHSRVPVVQVGVAAPDGLEWKPVGDGAWVAASVTFTDADPENKRRATVVNAYRPANDLKVAVLELLTDEKSVHLVGAENTVMIGTRTAPDGTSRGVRVGQRGAKGVLVLAEPRGFDARAELNEKVLYRFAVGVPQSVNLQLLDGRRIALKAGDFVAERTSRLKALAAKLDPANGGPDWSALTPELVEFVALEQGWALTAGMYLRDAISGPAYDLADELEAESPAAAVAWRAFLAEQQKRHPTFEPAAYAPAWTRALAAGGIAERGVFERIGRRALRLAGRTERDAAPAFALFRDADRAKEPEALLELRAKWRREIKDAAALTALDRAIVPVLRREGARLRAEPQKNPGTIAGLAFLAYQLDGGAPIAPIALNALREPTSDADDLGHARWWARVLVTGIWPALDPAHPETARLVAFLGAAPPFAANPAVAALGLRPGTPAGLAETIGKRPGRVPEILAGPVKIMPKDGAPPLAWPENLVFNNTDPATTKDPLIKQRDLVRRLRARPQELRDRFPFWKSYHEAPIQRLEELAARRRALEADQAAAAAGAQQAQRDWAAEQKRAWENPVLVMKPTQITPTHAERGGRTAAMAEIERRHAEQVTRANGLQGSLTTLRAEEAAARAAVRNSSVLGTEKHLLESIEAVEKELAREEIVLARLEAAEARRVFHQGVGGHDLERLVALRSYVFESLVRLVRALLKRPESPARARELQWWNWWLAIGDPAMGELPAALRPEAKWLAPVAEEIFREELHLALGRDDLPETFELARAAIDRAIANVRPMELAATIGPALLAFRDKLSVEENAKFRGSLGDRDLIVTGAMVKAATAKP